VNLVLRLAPNAVLTGTVLDEFGEPVRNAQITLYRENRFSGVSRISRVRSASTDDQGKYEATPLDEGTYFVSAKAAPWYAVHPSSAPAGTPNAPVQVDSALDVAYPITYYGDTTEADAATPIPVRGGDHLEADIHLNPVAALHLLFHTGENGIPGGYPQLRKPAFDGLEDVETGGFQIVSPGVYELTGIPAGQYMVRMPDSSGQFKEATSANLSSNQELDSSSGKPTSKVKVRVEVAGATTVPPEIQVGLRNSSGRATWSAVDAKGEANFLDITPGKFDVLADSQNEIYSVTRIAWDGGHSSGRNLDVPAGASLSVAVTLTGGSVRVEGFAKRDGKGIAGAMVVLIPKNPEANHDRFRRDQTDLDGSFTLLNVSPGPYTVIAIEDGWDLDWAKPAVLEHYGRDGHPLTVGAHEKGTLHLPMPVDVESK
jgi:5-hydroxyisourate hydrolase-like protein (transthyretin family)